MNATAPTIFTLEPSRGWKIVLNKNEIVEFKSNGDMFYTNGKTVRVYLNYRFPGDDERQVRYSRTNSVKENCKNALRAIFDRQVLVNYPPLILLPSVEVGASKSVKRSFLLLLGHPPN